MVRKAELIDVVGGLYDCAIEPACWPQALERLAHALDCPAAGVSLQDPRQRRVKLLASWGFTPEFEQAMAQALPINPLLPSGWFMDEDEPYTGVGMLGREDYLATRFYREVLGPHGYFDAAITVFAKTSNRFGGLSVPHSLSQGEWTPEQLEDVRIVAPHVRRAVTIADLLESRALGADMLSATLDLLKTGIVLVDQQARIVHANHAGLAHIANRAGLRRDGDFLSARDLKAAADLRSAIATAAGTETLSLPKMGIAVPIGGPDGPDLAIWVLPLDAGLRRGLAAPFAARVAVFIREIGDTSPFPGELFVKRYGITPAECRVLMMLVQGMSLPETCDALGIGEPTVKTHLARLFAKTGTERQSDLMRLAISALAPAEQPSG